MKHLLNDRPPTAGLVARDVMRRQVLVIDARQSIGAAWNAMQAQHVEHAVVLERGVCLGVVTLGELWTAWCLELGPVSARTVLPLVTPAPCVAEETAIPQLCQVLLHSRYGAAMVLDEAGELLGLVTTDDVLAQLASPHGAPPR